MLNIILILIGVIYSVGFGYSIHLMEESTMEFDMENIGVHSSQSSVIVILAAIWPILALIGSLVVYTNTNKEEVK